MMGARRGWRMKFGTGGGLDVEWVDEVVVIAKMKVKAKAKESDSSC